MGGINMGRLSGIGQSIRFVAGMNPGRLSRFLNPFAGFLGTERGPAYQAALPAGWRGTTPHLPHGEREKSRRRRQFAHANQRQSHKHGTVQPRHIFGGEA